MILKRTLLLLLVIFALGCAADQGASWIERGIARAAQRCAIQVAIHRYQLETKSDALRPSPLRVRDASTIEPAITRVPPRQTRPATVASDQAPPIPRVEPLPIARDLSSVKPFRFSAEPAPLPVFAFTRNALPEIVVVPHAHRADPCRSRAAA